MQANRPQDALVQVDKAATIAIEAAKEGKLPSQYMIGAVSLASAMGRSLEGSKASELVDAALETVQSKLSSDELTAEHRSVIDLLRIKVQQGDPAKSQSVQALLAEHIAKCEQLFVKESDNQTKAAMMLGIWNTQLQTVDAQQSERIYEKASNLGESLIKESANANLVNAYIALASSYIGRNARNAPDLASKALDSAKTFLDGVESEDSKVTQAIEGFLKNTKNMERTIESSKRLLSMVGQPAPEIDPMEWLNGEPLSKLSDLKGKVVLVDFWAVWCGPCIATFPHLKHLDHEYKDKGLTILGVTRQYNMKWDDSKDNYVRSETPVELEEEMKMLEKFIAKHQLTHRMMLTPEKSEMQSQYAVSGIPHAVVIDKQGIVRLVKVGSGSQNAEEIENTIQKLLAE
jgi:thiol-disulfide isomerase/thioredoxin